MKILLLFLRQNLRIGCLLVAEVVEVMRSQKTRGSHRKVTLHQTVQDSFPYVRDS